MTQLSFVPVREKTLSRLLSNGAAFLKEKGVDSARLETEHLLSSILSCQKIDLYLEPEKQITSEQFELFWNYLDRRASDEPLQYITGCVEFFEMNLRIEPGVFIPRPETELIVEATKNMSPSPGRILDLCTGSGALAIALAKRFPSASIVATDCSTIALSVAQKNIKYHNCETRVSLLKGDLFEPIRTHFGEKRSFDLIVCNPPYISEKDRQSLPLNVRDFEPEIALFAPDDGKAFYRRILAEAPPLLTIGGTVLLELGVGQATWLKAFIEEETSLDGLFIDDWAGFERVACISKR